MYSISGERIAFESLALERSRDFAHLVSSGASPYVLLVECVRNEHNTESIVLDVQPTVPQDPAVPIQLVERIAVGFTSSDDRLPDVRALRSNFPRECVLHLNLVPADEPASLCLFAVPWNDVKLYLTAAELLFRIQMWLNDTAAGVLHRADQPLEPLFLYGPSRPHLIVTPALVDRLLQAPAPVQFGIIENGSQRVFAEMKPGRTTTGYAAPCLAIPLVSEPHEHCVLYNQPRTFRELHDQLLPLGIDLLTKVQMELLTRERQQNLAGFGFLVILVILLRKRHANADPLPELAAFFCADVHGQQRGLAKLAESLGLNVNGCDQTKIGNDVTVMLMSVHQELLPKTAALYSGTVEFDGPLVAVGAGALGSQVVLQAVRGGICSWTIIDPDVLLPHNLVRHVLSGEWLGHPKATALSTVANSLVALPTVKAIVADVQRPVDQGVNVKNALQQASAIVDMSASVSVARDLAFTTECPAKRCSLFANPSGTDLVFLGEDAERRYSLDQLEVQYYRAITTEVELRNHLAGGQMLGSCRSATSRISQDQMGVHSSNGVMLLRNWLQDDGAMAVAVISNKESATTTPVTIPLGLPIEVGKIGEWLVVTDSLFIEAIQSHRASSLPNETGGVLLAHIDIQRRIIYVVHQLSAPADSEHQPTTYIRGSHELEAAYQKLQMQTRGNLVYMGEWHSHPDNYAALPSSDDLQASLWIAEQSDKSSLPALMLIVGERGQTYWMLCHSAATIDREFIAMQLLT